MKKESYLARGLWLTGLGLARVPAVTLGRPRLDARTLTGLVRLPRVSITLFAYCVCSVFVRQN
jgi:hypothetical protein